MTVHVLMVTDMSGSMGGLAEDVRGGFNSYLNGLTGKDGNYRITATLFDHEYMPLCTDSAIADVPRLTAANYQPRGNTALLDAVGRTIKTFEHRIAELGDDDKVILVIQTDGHENSSHEYSYAAVKELLTERSKEGGKWAVLYIGAGADTWAQASAMGVNASNYVNTSGSKTATRATYHGLAAATAAYSGNATADETAAIVAAATQGT